MKTGSPALIAYLAAASSKPADMVVWMVDLYTITLVNGVVLRICSGDQSITINGNTFDVLSGATPDKPVIERSRVNSTVGLSVDDLIINISATPIVQINGIPVLATMLNGDFDGATVLVERLIMPTYGDISLGTLIWFSGTIADINDISPTSAKITVRALTELFNIQMPRNLFQPACRQTLFDAGCTLSKAAFQVSGGVGSTPAPTVIAFPTGLTQPGSTPGPTAAPALSASTLTGLNLSPTQYFAVVTHVTAFGESPPSPEATIVVGANLLLNVASPPPATGVIGYNVYVGDQPGSWAKQNGVPISIGTHWVEAPDGIVQGNPPPTDTTGYFTQGVVTFTSGLNTGLSRFVIEYQAGGLTKIIDALPYPPSPGDAFTILPGCDKSQPTCDHKFSNLIHFGGQPFIPQPETAA